MSSSAVPAGIPAPVRRSRNCRPGATLKVTGSPSSAESSSSASGHDRATGPDRAEYLRREGASVVLVTGCELTLFKPMVATEYGCCPYIGAADKGGLGWDIADYDDGVPRLRGEYQRDESEQVVHAGTEPDLRRGGSRPDVLVHVRGLPPADQHGSPPG